MDIALERWAEKLGNSRYMAISRSDGSLTPISECDEIQGWYALYREGLFAYWLDSGSSYMHWNGATSLVPNDARITWKNSALGRKFEVTSGGRAILRFTYHTLLRAPWRIVEAFQIVDDDWGLVFDLPSFVDSHFSSNELPNLLRMWNLRDDS